MPPSYPYRLSPLSRLCMYCVCVRSDGRPSNDSWLVSADSPTGYVGRTRVAAHRALQTLDLWSILSWSCESLRLDSYLFTIPSPRQAANLQHIYIHTHESQGNTYLNIPGPSGENTPMYKTAQITGPRPWHPFFGTSLFISSKYMVEAT